MRYKRVNTVALDVSSLPNNHRISPVQPFVAHLNLNPAKLKSVQVHSSRKVIYIGLPKDQSAAAVAAKIPRFKITLDGVKHYVPLVYVDEDVVDVRVRDVPPETPNGVIENTLKKYGDVLSITSEVWKDFFPGVLTGVRIARMKVAQNIPTTLSIGNTKAIVTYTGQNATCRRCSQPAHNNSECKTAAVIKKKAKASNDPPKQKSDDPQEQRQKQSPQEGQQQQAQKKITQQPIATPSTSKPMDCGNDAASTGFTVVKRKRGKGTPTTTNNNNNNESDSTDPLIECKKSSSSEAN